MYQAGSLGWKARQHIFEVCVGVMPIEPSALNQAHHSGTALARTKRAGEQPVVAANIHSMLGTAESPADLVFENPDFNSQLTVEV